jgi:hypothetical protein
MAVNFGLLQPAQPASAFFQGQQDVQREAEQNMLRQTQAEQRQFERENMLAQRQERNLLAQQRSAQDARAAQRQQFLTGAAEALAQGGEKLDRPTLMKVLQNGVQAGEPTLIQFARESMRALDEEEVYAREATRFGLSGAAAPAAGEPANALAAPAPAGITRETVQNMMTSPSARIREQGKALAQTLPKEEATPADVAAMKALGFPLTQQGYEQFRAAQRQPPTYTPSPDMQGYELAKSEGYKGTFFDYQRQLAEAKRPPAQPKEPTVQPPIAVVDEATGRVKYVTREEAIGKTPAAAIEGLTPKERQQREAKFPQATSAVKTFETTSNTLIKDLETLAKHPGLSSITGIAAGRLPGITSAGREAEALFDKISARGGFQELQNMRQASPTGGALGNVSNQEGAQLRQAFAALDRRQDAASVRKAISDAINQIRASQQTIKDAYDMTYEYKQGGGGAAPAAAPNIDALLNKYR